MNHGTILKRAWNILWKYKALWVFGILLAFVTASAQPNSFYNMGQSNRQDNRDSRSSSERWEYVEGDFRSSFDDAFAEMEVEFESGIPVEVRGEVITFLVITGLVILVLIVVGLFIRYVSEVALIKMVDDYEETSEKLSIRQGFRLGWSRSAFRVFLIDLLISLPLFLFFVCVASFFILLMASGSFNNGLDDVLRMVTGIGAFFISILFAILVSVVLALFKHFFYRAAVLENKGVMDAIRYGYSMVRSNLKDVGIMWLIMAAINGAFPIVTAPIAFIFVAFGTVIGGLGGLVAYQVAGGFDNPLAVLPVIIVGAVLFILVVGFPITLLNGLRLVFVSNTWTLSYRELRSAEQLKNGDVVIDDNPPPVVDAE